MPPLDGDEVGLREFRPEDRSLLVRARDLDDARFLGEPHDDWAPTLGIWAADRLVGWIDIDDHREWLYADEVNVGYAVFPEHRGRGYAARAMRLLCDRLGTAPRPVVPTLLIDPGNEPSLMVAARAGFAVARSVDAQLLFRSSSAPSSSVSRS